MNKVWMMGSVAMVAGGLMLSAGCGTTRPPAQETAVPVVMPPTTPPPVVVPKVEEVKPVVAEVTAKTYVVKSGDSISHIAARFKVPSRDILKLNNLSNPNKIRVGQKLTLPGYVDLNAPAPVVKAHKKTAKTAKTGKSVKKAVAAKTAPVEGAVPAVEGAPVAPAADAAVAPAPAPKSNEVLHVVEPNQELSAIAMMYGVRVEEVMKLNNLTSPDVKVGQTLKIPPPVE
ncbi:MAG: LysM peptidoglycan-binding domain-containing protein [bacterium]